MISDRPGHACVHPPYIPDHSGAACTGVSVGFLQDQEPVVAGPILAGKLALVSRANSFKAILLQIIEPSSHDRHRRRDFQPRPTRFCLMKADRDEVAVS
ncbi:hypothetical protein OIU76_010343 [Salix suchowensis]|nr:hypothetical protein OIU76_010343 [Salix suchowensis]